jgi:hypothetical protein
LTTVVAWRGRIEERDKGPAQDASDDEGQSIGENAIETRPSSADLRPDATTRNKTATDYSASAFLFPFFVFDKHRGSQVLGKEGAGLIENFNFPCSDPIHDRRSCKRGDKKPASEIDVSASALSSAGRRWVVELFTLPFLVRIWYSR